MLETKKSSSRRNFDTFGNVIDGMRFQNGKSICSLVARRRNAVREEVKEENSDAMSEEMNE